MAQQKPQLLPVVLAAVSALLLLSTAQTFVSAPARTNPVMGAAAAAGLLAPLAANAELPPLEDLPLEEIDPTREFGPRDATFMGISFPMVLGAIVFAIGWAGIVVSNLKPAKEEDGSYTTYTGAGELPPVGFTNPLDPRLSEEYAVGDELEALNASKKLPKKKESSGSAVV